MDLNTIRAAMAREAIGVRELARRTHYDPAYISRALRGQQRASDALLRAMAAALDIDEADERVAHAAANPRRIDGAAVEALEAALRAQRRADDVVGPGPLIGGAEASAAAFTGLLREARGPQRDALAGVVSEWVQFAGWLHAESRLADARAGVLLDEAVELADDAGSGPLAAQALGFRGWLARQQQRPRAAVRWFMAAFHTPGAEPIQRMEYAAQAARELALLGDEREAHRQLAVAEALADRLSPPPGTSYWLSAEFMELHYGMAYVALGNASRGVEFLRSGLAALPADQKGAEWAREYHEALRAAEANS